LRRDQRARRLSSAPSRIAPNAIAAVGRN